MTWTSNTLPVSVRYWYSVASSADGNKVAVVSQYGQICTSTNAGASWQQAVNAPSLIWASIASSADGTRLVTVSQLQYPLVGGSIYTSSDSGTTWISNNAPNVAWYFVASSADGTKLVASASHSTYVSSNAGANWELGSSGNNTFNTLASSADGNQLISIYGGGIAGYFGGVYESYSTPAPVLNITSSITNLVLCWTIPSTNFLLQQSPDLISWAAVTDAPALNFTNLQNQVTLPPSNTSGFYRLISQ